MSGLTQSWYFTDGSLKEVVGVCVCWGRGKNHGWHRPSRPEASEPYQFVEGLLEVLVGHGVNDGVD